MAALWVMPAEHTERRSIHKVLLSRLALARRKQVRLLTYNGPGSIIFRRAVSQSMVLLIRMGEVQQLCPATVLDRLA